MQRKSHRRKWKRQRQQRCRRCPEQQQQQLQQQQQSEAAAYRLFSLRRPLPRAERNHISLPALVVPDIVVFVVVTAATAIVVVVVVAVAIKITEHLPLHTWPTLATWRLQQAKQRVAVVVVVIRLCCPKSQAHFASIRLTIFTRGGSVQGVVVGGIYILFHSLHRQLRLPKMAEKWLKTKRANAACHKTCSCSFPLLLLWFFFCAALWLSCTCSVYLWPSEWVCNISTTCGLLWCLWVPEIYIKNKRTI